VQNNLLMCCINTCERSPRIQQLYSAFGHHACSLYRRFCHISRFFTGF